MSNINAIAYKASNTVLAGTLIPYYSTVALALPYAGATASNYPNLSQGYGTTAWRNGVDIGGTANGSSNQAVSYAIYSDTFTQGVTTSGNSVGVAWGVIGSSTTDILNVVNALPAMYPVPKHSSYSDASAWLINNGYFLSNRDYPSISYSLTNSLVVALDPSFSASYPMTSNILYDLCGSATEGCEMFTGVIWDSSNKNSLLYDGNPNTFTGLPSTIADNLNSLNSMSVNLWFKPDSISTNAAINKTLFMLHAGTSGNSAGVGGGSAVNGVFFRLFISVDKLYIEGNVSGSGILGSPVQVATIPNTLWNNISLGISVGSTTNNINVSLNGGSVSQYSYDFGTPISTAGIDFGSIGAARSMPGPESIVNTEYAGGIGALYIYKGQLTDTQLKDIYFRTLSIYP